MLSWMATAERVYNWLMCDKGYDGYMASSRTFFVHRESPALWPAPYLSTVYSESWLVSYHLMLVRAWHWKPNCTPHRRLQASGIPFCGDHDHYQDWRISSVPLCVVMKSKMRPPCRCLWWPGWWYGARERKTGARISNKASTRGTTPA